MAAPEFLRRTHVNHHRAIRRNERHPFQNEHGHEVDSDNHCGSQFIVVSEALSQNRFGVVAVFHVHAGPNLVEWHIEEHGLRWIERGDFIPMRQLYVDREHILDGHARQVHRVFGRPKRRGVSQFQFGQVLPRSKTMISQCSQSRLARAAALAPSATPPTVTKCLLLTSKRLSALVRKATNGEAGDCASGADSRITTPFLIRCGCPRRPPCSARPEISATRIRRGSNWESVARTLGLQRAAWPPRGCSGRRWPRRFLLRAAETSTHSSPRPRRRPAACPRPAGCRRIAGSRTGP